MMDIAADSLIRSMHHLQMKSLSFIGIGIGIGLLSFGITVRVNIITGYMSKKQQEILY